MRALVFVTAVAVGWTAVGRSAADDDKTVEELKKKLAGKWVPEKGDDGPVDFTADGKIKEPFGKKDGTWAYAEGTYTIDAKGEIKFKVEKDGVSLSGWYKFKDGVLS